MRIYGPNGTNAAGGAPQARRTGTSSFTLSQPDAARPAAAARPSNNIGGIDALLALQGLEDSTERRRRAVKRGRGALDALDDLKLALLAGSLDAGALARLGTMVTDLADGSGDPALDNVLAEIRLRVEVEVAKFGAPQPHVDRTT
jgi:Class II flagellar assembly regulator